MLSAGTCVEWLRDDLGIIDDRRRLGRGGRRAATTPATSGSCPPCSAWAPRCGTSAPGAPSSASPGAAAGPSWCGPCSRAWPTGAPTCSRRPSPTRACRSAPSASTAGMTANPVFVQALADACGRPVEIAPVLEATTLGAAYLAGMAVGTWADEDEVAAAWIAPAGGRAGRERRRAVARPGPVARGPRPGRGHHPRALGPRLLRPGRPAPGSAGPARARSEPSGPGCRRPEPLSAGTRDAYVWVGYHARRRIDRNGRVQEKQGTHEHRHEIGMRAGRPARRGPGGPVAVHRRGGGLGPGPPRCPVGGPARHPGRRHHRRGGRPVRQPPADRGRARRGQDRAGPGAGHRARRRAVPDPGPPRPPARPTSPGSPSSPRTPAPGSSAPARSSPTWSSSTSSTGRRRGPSRPCSSPWRSSRSRSTASRGPSPGPTWSSAPRTRSASSAPTRWSRASSTASGSPPPSATPTPRSRPASSSTTAVATPSTPWSRWPTRPSGNGPSRPPPSVQVVTRGGRVRRRPGPGHPLGRDRPPGRQPPGGHLPAPLRPGLRRALGRAYVTPERRPGGGRGVPVPPPPRRGERRRRPGPGRPDHRRHARPPDVSGPRPPTGAAAWRAASAASGRASPPAWRRSSCPGPASARGRPGGAGVGVGALAIGPWCRLVERHRRRPAPRLRLAAPRRAPAAVGSHPVAWFGPVVGSVITVLAWAGVAHSSGSGWVQAVGALLAAFLADRAGGSARPGPAGRGSPAPTCPSDGAGRAAAGLTVEPTARSASGPGTRRARSTRPGAPAREPATVIVDVHPGPTRRARRRRRRGGVVAPPSACCGGPGRSRSPCPARSMWRRGPASRARWRRRRRPRRRVATCGSRPGPASPGASAPTGRATPGGPSIGRPPPMPGR